VPAPEWFSKGSLPQWVFQTTGLGCLVFIVIVNRHQPAVLLPAVLVVAGVAAFIRYAGGRPARDGEDET
jgi:cytochrome c biogenesis factor